MDPQVIFVHVGTSGTLMTTAILNGATTNSSGNAVIHYGATNADGTNGSTANDNLNLTLTTTVDPALIPTTLTDQFCSGTDWVVKVQQVQYSVDTAIDPAGPTLVRIVNSGTHIPMASQIIGFKVGASTVTLNGQHRALQGIATTAL